MRDVRRLVHWSGVHHSATVLAGAGTELQHEIGLLNGGQVMLDHYDGIARIRSRCSNASRRSVSLACSPTEGSSRT